jgi:hypothetical protein
MLKLKSWFQVVTPRDNVRENRPLDASEFAVHLDHVREHRAPKDYQEPERFFERTYTTKNLEDLAAQTVRRLSGIGVVTHKRTNSCTKMVSSQVSQPGLQLQVRFSISSSGATTEAKVENVKTLLREMRRPEETEDALHPEHRKG